MITDSEITAVELSPTKRDFYQIWNELLDTASKLSNRWDPSSTNESDPGIVLLKVLTAIADKLNYTIDKNTLEAFMPSATQEESMRKLCDMLGYTMKYYRSATCPVQISYVGTDYDLEADNCSISIPKFTNIKNEDQDVNYVTLSDITLGTSISYDEVECMEGEEVDYDDITRDQLDDNHRYYLPEAQIAENGIFLWTKDQDVEYEKVTNLNTQKLGTRCWKFGYDSREDMPYIEFPSDIDSLIGQGITFKYIRTNGTNGNISVGLLNNMDASSCKLYTSSNEEEVDCDDSWFSVTNTAASTNGQDKETIDEAYNSYKKTIGTFDTLISCRDYMNKIYQLTQGDIEDSSSTTPLVSNIIASDIRDDINRGVTVCTFTANGTTFDNQSKKDASGNDEIDSFDILLYPFKKVNGLNTKSEYVNSFKYTDENLTEIKSGIEQNKTIAHHIISPTADEIACVKDYIKVKAKITTIAKVNTIAENAILNKVFTALYKNFNMRKLDFGESITDEMIQDVILNADSRIKNVQLSTDHSLAFDKVSGTSMKDATDYKDTFINLAVLNVLAGRVALFNYDESFEPALNEKTASGYEQVYYPKDKPGKTGEDKYNWGITRIEASYTPGVTDIKVDENEVIQFRAPSFKTTVTYPSYVNYFIKLNKEQKEAAIAASFKTLKDFFNETRTDGTLRIKHFIQKSEELKYLSFKAQKETSDTTDNLLAKYTEKYIWVFELNESIYSLATEVTEGKTYYYLPFGASNKEILGNITNYLKLEESGKLLTVWYESIDDTGKTTQHAYDAIYKSMGVDTSRSVGNLVDSNYVKYAATTAVPGMSTTGRVNSDCLAWVNLYLPNPDTYKDANNQKAPTTAEEAGLGKDAVLDYIEANQEYELMSGEYLLINYTSSSTDDSGNESSTVVNKIYTAGELIRPSFDLSDSNTVHTNKSTSWSKKSGFTFNDTNITQPEGMFSLSTNEQIEIIEPVVVTLGPDEDSTVSSTMVNIYWVRNDDDINAAESKDGYAKKTMEFNWDEDPVYEDGKFVYYSAYTLKENEYFFYTNKNKTDLAYYGNGTKIKKNAENVTLTKSIGNDEEVTADDILQYGLAASIPWVTMALTKQKNITIHEYQYINLVNGGKLKGIDNLDSSSSNYKDGGVNQLNSRWQGIKSATYTLDAASAEKNNEYTELHEIKISGMNWEVRSLLQLNMSPTLIQTLHADDKITAYMVTAQYKAEHGIQPSPSDSDTHYIPGTIMVSTEEEEFSEYWTRQPAKGFGNTISLKSNKMIQSTSPTTYVSPDSFLQLKAVTLADEDVQKINDISINFGNFGDNITNIAVDSSVKNLPLYTCIPQDNFGLMMFYVSSTDQNSSTDTEDKSCTITLRTDKGTLNRYNSDESASSTLILKDGIAIVKISAECTTITINPNNKGTLTFSNLDIIPNQNSLNPKLGLSTFTGDQTEAVLNKIKKYDIDNKFYYNNIIDNGNSIRFNANDDDDTLMNVDAWYDYNNVANKFFIPELDASYFSDCIVIDKASKLK